MINLWIHNTNRPFRIVQNDFVLVHNVLNTHLDIQLQEPIPTKNVTIEITFKDMPTIGTKVIRGIVNKGETRGEAQLIDLLKAPIGMYEGTVTYMEEGSSVETLQDTFVLQVVSSMHNLLKTRWEPNVKFMSAVANVVDYVSLIGSGGSGGVGIPGPTGPTGPKGDKGDKGDTGTNGTDGTNGTNGTNGTDGAKGKNLEFHWKGTQLGVRQEGDTNYIYQDLQGPGGGTGPVPPPVLPEGPEDIQYENFTTDMLTHKDTGNPFSIAADGLVTSASNPDGQKAGMYFKKDYNVLEFEISRKVYFIILRANDDFTKIITCGLGEQNQDIAQVSYSSTNVTYTSKYRFGTTAPLLNTSEYRLVLGDKVRIERTKTGVVHFYVKKPLDKTYLKWFTVDLSTLDLLDTEFLASEERFGFSLGITDDEPMEKTDALRQKIFKNMKVKALPVGEVTDIELTPSKYDLSVGDTCTITATVNPSTATNKNIKWTSSNTEVATVSDTGVVTAIKDGTVIITAMSRETALIYANVELYVDTFESFKTDMLHQNSSDDRLSIDSDGLVTSAIEPNENKTCMHFPEKYNFFEYEVERKFTYIVIRSNEDFSKVITCGLGEANRTLAQLIYKPDGSAVSVTMKYNHDIFPDTNTPAHRLSKGDKVRMDASEIGKMHFYVRKIGKNNFKRWFTLELGKLNLLESEFVSAGNRFGFALGLSASEYFENNSESKKKIFKNMKVKSLPMHNTDGLVPPFKVTLNKKTTAINKGATETLVATVTPDHALSKFVQWSTSNSSVATVDDTGLVTAINEGTATILAKSLLNANLTDSCVVTVKQPVTSVTIDPIIVLTHLGQTPSVTTTVAPTDATNKAFTYSIANTNIATIDTSGTITPLITGETTITVTSSDDISKTNTIKLKVAATDYKYPTSLSWIHTINTVPVGESTPNAAEITPTDAGNKGILYTSSDPNICACVETIIGQGPSSIEGKSVGNAVITATSAEDPRIAITQSIRVTESRVVEPEAEVPATRTKRKASYK